MTARHLQQPGPVSHAHARKDYGHPLRVWEYKGVHVVDRYTIMPPRSGRAAAQYRERNGEWQAIAASADPFSPQGFGQHITCRPGPHLGQRITWAELPEPVQRFALQSFPEWAPAAMCDDCRRVSPVSQLRPVRDYSERVAADEPAPAGECPHCGALAHAVDP